MPSNISDAAKRKASLKRLGALAAIPMVALAAAASAGFAQHCLPVTALGPLQGSVNWAPSAVNIALGSDGRMAVAGVSPSADIGTPLSFQPRPRNTNAFGSTFSNVSKIRSDGVPAFVAYLGGSGPFNNTVSAVAMDPSGHIYVTGAADSLDFPLKNPTGPTTPSNIDVYVSKITPDGGSVIYSTLIGGRATELPTAIAANELGEVFVGGTTGSPDFQTQPSDNDCDTPDSFARPFVAKFSASGALLFSRQLGPLVNGASISQLLADGAGGVFVAGSTSGAGLPLAGAANGGWDGFIARLNASGDLVAAAYLGGSQADAATAVVPLPDGDLLVASRSNSPDFTGAPLPAGRTNGVIPRLAYLTRLSADAREVRWSRRLETSDGCEITQLQPLADGTVAALVYTTRAAVSDGSTPVSSFLLRVDPGAGEIAGATPLPELDLRPVAISVSDDGVIHVAGSAFWKGPGHPTIPGAAMPVRCDLPIGSMAGPTGPSVRWLAPSGAVPGVLTRSVTRNLLSVGLSVEDWRNEATEVDLHDSGMLLARWTQPPYSLVWTNPDARLHAFRVSWKDGGGQVHDSIALDYPIAAAAPTDRFSTRARVPGDGSAVLGSVLGCTATPPSSDSREMCGNTAWFSWTAAQDGMMQCDVASLAATGSETVALETYEGASLAGLKLLGVVNPGTSSVGFSFPARAGVDYAFRVQTAPGRGQSYAVDSGLGQFRLQLHPVFPPVNDSRSTPLLLTGTSTGVTGTTRGATGEPDDGTFRYVSLPNTVWFSWTAPETSAFLVEATPAGSLPVLLKVLTPSGKSVMNEGDIERGLVFTPVARSTYLISVGSASPGTEFTLSIQPAPSPIIGTIQESGESWSSSVATFLTSPGTPRLAPSWQWTAPKSGSYWLHAQGEFLNATLSVKPLGAAVASMASGSDPNAITPAGATADMVFGAEGGVTYVFSFAAPPVRSPARAAAGHRCPCERQLRNSSRVARLGASGRRDHSRRDAAGRRARPLTPPGVGVVCLDCDPGCALPPVVRVERLRGARTVPGGFVKPAHAAGDQPGGWHPWVRFPRRHPLPSGGRVPLRRRFPQHVRRATAIPGCKRRVCRRHSDPYRCIIVRVERPGSDPVRRGSRGDGAFPGVGVVVVDTPLERSPSPAVVRHHGPAPASVPAWPDERGSDPPGAGGELHEHCPEEPRRILRCADERSLPPRGDHGM
jgi:hypothetical protein